MGDARCGQQGVVDMAKNWIAKAVGKNPGGLHKSLGVPAGKKIPLAKIQQAASRPGKVGAQGRLAMTLSKIRGR